MYLHQGEARASAEIDGVGSDSDMDQLLGPLDPELRASVKVMSEQGLLAEAEALGTVDASDRTAASARPPA